MSYVVAVAVFLIVPDQAAPVNTCLIMHEHVLSNARHQERVVDMLNSLPENSRVHMNVVGAHDVQDLGTVKISNGENSSYRKTILDVKVTVRDERELSAVLVHLALMKCFTADVDSKIAKISLVVGKHDTELVSNPGLIWNQNIKTYVLNVTPGRPLRPSFSALATDADHNIDIDNIATFKKILAFGKHLCTIEMCLSCTHK